MGESKNPNVFEVLGVAAKEDVVSNLLRHLLESEQAFGKWFLTCICKLGGDLAVVRADTRVRAGERGIPDLVVVARAPDGSKRCLVILENKLKADEGADQTKRYGSDQVKKDLLKRYEEHFDSSPEVEVKHVFLTLFPDQKSEACCFQDVTYETLSNKDLDDLDWSNEVNRRLASDFQNFLKGFYPQGQLEDTTCLLDALSHSDPLDGSYLAFGAFAKKVNLPIGLELETRFRASQMGRYYYGATFSKKDWHPNLMKCETEVSHNEESDELSKCRPDCKWKLGENTFNIHFELQFNKLHKGLEFEVHYQVNPYWPEEKVKKHTKDPEKDENAGYAAYKKRREDFAEKLKESAESGNLKFVGRSVQIAKVVLGDLNRCSVADVSRLLSQRMCQIGRAIDEILIKMNGSSEA